MLLKADRIIRWVLGILCYLEGDDLLHSVIAIRDTLSDLLESNYHQARRGRPTLPIEEPHIRFYVENNFNVSQIADLFGCSKRTIERRMQQYGIRMRERYSTISDHDLRELVLTVTYSNPNLGERSVDGKCIGKYMLHFRGTGRGSIIMGCSVHNQRIERLWHDLFTGCVSFHYHLFIRCKI